MPGMTWEELRELEVSTTQLRHQLELQSKSQCNSGSTVSDWFAGGDDCVGTPILVAFVVIFATCSWFSATLTCKAMWEGQDSLANTMKTSAMGTVCFAVSAALTCTMPEEKEKVMTIMLVGTLLFFDVFLSSVLETFVFGHIESRFASDPERVISFKGWASTVCGVIQMAISTVQAHSIMSPPPDGRSPQSTPSHHWFTASFYALFYLLLITRSHACFRANRREGPTEEMDRFSTKFSFSPEQKKAESKSACSICLSVFKVGDECRRLQCAHTFHTGCIDDWVSTGRGEGCPLCRTPVTPLSQGRNARERQQREHAANLGGDSESDEESDGCILG